MDAQPNSVGISSFSTWLTRVAMNEALMLLRKKRGSREVLAHGFGYACVCIWEICCKAVCALLKPGLSVEPDVRVR